MGAQNGKDLLIKVDMTSDGQFETIAGLRATRVSFNAEAVDVTSLESQGGWRELLSGPVCGRPAFLDRVSSRTPARMSAPARFSLMERRRGFRSSSRISASSRGHFRSRLWNTAAVTMVRPPMRCLWPRRVPCALPRWWPDGQSVAWGRAFGHQWSGPRDASDPWCIGGA